jgi:DNA polymerase-2
MKEYTGWLFDLYAHPTRGVALWLAGRDGKRHCFYQDFEIVFYAGGAFPRLRELWRFLRPRPVKLARTRRDDLYSGPQDLMEVRVADPTIYAELFREASREFPDLTYYDADIPLILRYAAAFGVFPMACCRILARPDGQLIAIAATDTPWELDPELPALRTLTLRPDADPGQAPPRHLLAAFSRFKYRIPLDRPRELLHLLNGILLGYNPDIILSSFGDTWLFTHLEQLSQQTGIPFNPNRDPARDVARRREVSFFNYGHAHYRGEQVHLFGRWHIDDRNCMTFNDYGVGGAIEQARLTGLPVQEIARRSPGAGIAAMQTLTALRRGVLIPYQHQKGEVAKTYNQLFQADRGGLVFQPPVGIFPNVAILDFISMYPSIMVKYNLSPETVGADEETAPVIPGLGIRVGSRLGLVPETLRPVVEKRVALKRRLRDLSKHDPLYRRYKALSKALKWLLVVAYGRLGYANSAFGRINSHEAVTHLGRKVLLQAKTVAEDHGFTVLHLYVDSLFVCRPDAALPADFRTVIDSIERETGLPIELEALYSWMAFLAARHKPGLSVANRFFGRLPEGGYKIRGLALRREDTPAFVAALQTQVLNILARESNPARLGDLLPEVVDAVRERLAALQAGQVSPGELIVTQTLSREPAEYRVSSPLARAAAQLQAAGRPLRMGQRVHFLHIRSRPGVFASDLPLSPGPGAIDISRYRELSLRAVHEVLQPLGVSEDGLRDCLSGQGYIRPADLARLTRDPLGRALPLFAGLQGASLFT